MGWQGSDRRARLPPEWPQLVAAVRERAGGRCEHRPIRRMPDGSVRLGTRCPHPGSDCDHKRRGDDHSLGNLQWLCIDHHREKTSREGVEARAALGRRRPQPRHPGLAASPAERMTSAPSRARPPRAPGGGP